MGMIFFDGFDHYDGVNQGGRKWDQASAFNNGIISSVGRFGGHAAIIGYAKKTIPNTSAIVVGAAMKFDTFYFLGDPPTEPILMFKDGTTDQVCVFVDRTDFTLKVRETASMTSPLLLSTSFVPPLNLWFYLEVKMVFGNPGNIELRVNGQTIGTATGVQVTQTGSSFANHVDFNTFHGFANYRLDDVYMLDTTGSWNNDFLGEVRVQTKFPDADGTTIDFQRSQGLYNYVNANSNVTGYLETGLYNFSGTVGQKDLYSIQNFTVSGDIFAVQNNLSFRKDDVGNRSVAPLLRTASVEYVGDTAPCYSDYTHTAKIWELNPGTSLPWNLTDLNQAEFGIKVTA